MRPTPQKTPTPLTSRPILLASLSILSVGSLSYLLHKEMKKFDGPHPSLSSDSSPSSTPSGTPFAPTSNQGMHANPLSVDRLYPSANVDTRLRHYASASELIGGIDPDASAKGMFIDGAGLTEHVEDKGLMLAPTQAVKAREDDTLIENIVLYLG